MIVARPAWASAPVDPALQARAEQTLERLRACSPEVWATGLSAAGARYAWEAALTGLESDDLARRLVGAAPRRVGIVCSGNVFIAPLEWVVSLALRGVDVVLKPATGQEAAVHGMVAALSGLPGRVEVAMWRGGDVETEAFALAGCDAVLGFGGAEAMEAIGARVAMWRPAPRWLPFGPKAGVALVASLDHACAARLADDHALHDGRGCMSPAAVLAVDADLEAMATAMAAAQATWPRGEVSPAEGAAIRARIALARVLGRVHEGEGWAVLELPVSHLRLTALPRVAVVHRVRSLEEADTLVAAQGDGVGTLATDTVAGMGLRDASNHAPRVCAPGEMQRPPFARFHDGLDVLGALWRR